MRTPELAKGINRILDRSSGAVGATVADIVIRLGNYRGQENIQLISEKLGEGKSVLLVSDHPSTLATIYATGLIPQYMSNRKESGVVLRDGFVSGELGITGWLAINILNQHGIEPLDVKTPKYEPCEDVRTSYNLRSVRRCMEILGKPGGLLLIFASGTRNVIMPEAEEGMGRFSSMADLVVPMTTIEEGSGRPVIVVNEPIPGKAGAGWCRRRYGKETGRQVFSDLVMSIIACGQPNEEKRGFYKELAAELEGYIRDQTGTIMQMTDLRAKRMIEAYGAWKSGRFAKGEN